MMRRKCIVKLVLLCIIPAAKGFTPTSSIKSCTLQHLRSRACNRRLKLTHSCKSQSNDDIAICSKQQFISSSLLIASMMFTFSLVPDPSLAFDHPVDAFHLNIPNPIPDADPRYFFAGGLCAAASHGITTPIDVVKTTIQANPQKYNQGLLSATQQIFKEDGPQALLRGLGPTIIGYGTEGAVKFGLYESLKPEMARILSLQDGDNLTIPYLVASVTAGAAASLLLCPMEQTRIRLVTDPKFSSLNLITGIPLLVEESGGNVLSLFSGLPAMLSKQVPYTFAKQVSFDTFASMLYGFTATYLMLNPTEVKIPVSFGAAFLASVLACIMSHPGDVILTATYKNSKTNTSESSSSSWGNIVSQIYQNQGLTGFFSGLNARFLHVGMIITSQLVLYDFVKQLLGLPATGTH